MKESIKNLKKEIILLKNKKYTIIPINSQNHIYDYICNTINKTIANKVIKYINVYPIIYKDCIKIVKLEKKINDLKSQHMENIIQRFIYEMNMLN